MSHCLFEDFLNCKSKFFYFWRMLWLWCIVQREDRLGFSKGSFGARFLWTTSSTTKGFMAWLTRWKDEDESWKYSSSNTTLSWLSWSKMRLGPCHCRIWNLRSLQFYLCKFLGSTACRDSSFADSCRNTWCDCIPCALDVPTAVGQLGTFECTVANFYGCQSLWAVFVLTSIYSLHLPNPVNTSISYTEI